MQPMPKHSRTLTKKNITRVTVQIEFGYSSGKVVAFIVMNMAMGEAYPNATNQAPSPVFGEGVLSASALDAANINPTTGLATDYLNHFNEVIMLMEMLPDMPDCVEDVLEWAPLDYAGHFQNSGFKDRDLAILAYEHAPREVKAHFDTVVLQLDTEVQDVQEALRRSSDADQLQQAAHAATHQIKPLISAASGAIHGTTDHEPEYEDEGVQADIDALFD